VLVPRIPAAGVGCRSLPRVGPWPTGVCAGHQPRSVRHARGQRGDISAVPGRRATSEECDDPARRITYPRTARARRLFSELSWRRGPGRVRRIVTGCGEIVNPCEGSSCPRGSAFAAFSAVEACGCAGGFGPPFHRNGRWRIVTSQRGRAKPAHPPAGTGCQRTPTPVA
jgi:hypothetical protein